MVQWRGRIAVAALCVLTTAALLAVRASADQIPSGWEASNLEPIGYSGLDGRGGAFKMAIKHVNDKWYLFMGHEWHRGWTILDVTDPKDPKFVKFVPGPDNTNTIQMEFHDNLMLTALQKKQTTWGGDPTGQMTRAS